MTSAPPAVDPRVPLMLTLSITTGMIDAISVLGLGKVFTANMTGNVVFLGFAAASAQGFKALSYITAITAFLCGALLAGRAGKTYVGKPLRRWLMAAATFEAGLLCIAAGVATGFDVATQSPEISLYAVIALTAVAMGFRNATIRQLKIPDLTTTVLTMTLTGLAADSSLARGSNPNWQRRIAAVAAIFVGALIGALLVSRWALALPLALTAALILMGTLACALHPAFAAPATA